MQKYGYICDQEDEGALVDISYKTAAAHHLGKQAALCRTPRALSMSRICSTLQGCTSLR